MQTQQLLVRLPEDLIRRLRRSVPARGRSAFVQHLLEQALPSDVENTALLEAALAVEQDQELADEMAEWECTVGDGFSSFK